MVKRRQVSKYYETDCRLQGTIGIAINLIFTHNPNLNITKGERKKLFIFSKSQTLFLFNFKFYNQIDGVAMRSSLAAALASSFVGLYKSKWLNEYNLNKLKFY